MTTWTSDELNKIGKAKNCRSLRCGGMAHCGNR